MPSHFQQIKLFNKSVLIVLSKHYLFFNKLGESIETFCNVNNYSNKKVNGYQYL